MSRANHAGAADAGIEAAVPDAAVDGNGGEASTDASARAAARVDYALGGFFDAPFPDERLRKSDGSIDLGGLPTGGVALIDELVKQLRDASGFGRTSGVFFALTAPVDTATLPDLTSSDTAAATVFLMDVDSASSSRGTRVPVSVAFEADGGPLGAPNLLSVLPLQGRPLAANRLYAAVITRGVHGIDGAPLDVAPATASILANQSPPGLSQTAFAAHREAIQALGAAGVDPKTIAATAVFRTGDPSAGLVQARQAVLNGTVPAVQSAFVAQETFDDYCVFKSTLPMPDYQTGTPPYQTPAEGGTWSYDSTGALTAQTAETSNVVVTIPRLAMPASGFPIVVFVRTNAGGDRPLVDRGVQASVGGPALTPGTGPALEFARAGFAAVSVDGPLGGLRNGANWDESLTLQNFPNPGALRDNVREGALELVVLARVLADLRVDASSCAGFSTPSNDGLASFDLAELSLMAHSAGASMGALAFSVEPAYRNFVASGAGASFIEQVLHEQRPIPLAPVLELLFGYAAQQRQLSEHDVALSLFAWALEPADPQVYAELVAPSAQNVLMIEGSPDTFAPPPMADALTLSLGLDLAGSELTANYAGYPTLASLLPFANASSTSFPVAGNRSNGAATRVLAQHPADAVEDGHEVVFQTDPPKRQYRCFLDSVVRTGVARVPSGSGDVTTCD